MAIVEPTIGTMNTIEINTATNFFISQPWSEFSRLATQFQLALRGFYDSEFATALRKLCKG